MISDAQPLLEPCEEDASVPATILIVDDDEDQAFCLATRLQNIGFKTETAHTGAEALRLAHEIKPELILLDLRLPDSSGFDVCAELADASDTCDIPVIVVSALDQQDVVRLARSAGCRFFVHKPYDPNALLALIETSLGSLDW